MRPPGRETGPPRYERCNRPPANCAWRQSGVRLEIHRAAVLSLTAETTLTPAMHFAHLGTQRTEKFRVPRDRKQQAVDEGAAIRQPVRRPPGAVPGREGRWGVFGDCGPLRRPVWLSASLRRSAPVSDDPGPSGRRSASLRADVGPVPMPPLPVQTCQTFVAQVCTLAAASPEPDGSRRCRNWPSRSRVRATRVRVTMPFVRHGAEANRAAAACEIAPDYAPIHNPGALFRWTSRQGRACLWRMRRRFGGGCVPPVENPGCWR